MDVEKCFPSASQVPPSALLQEASHAGPASQLPVTTHQTAPAPGDQMKNPVPAVTAVPYAAEPVWFSAWDGHTSHCDSNTLSDENTVYKRK